MDTARTKAKIQNSLLTLIQAFEGELITVELRNECSVTGLLNYVDMYMNLSISHAEFTSYNGRSSVFESFYVQGQNVRFVPIPSHIDMKEVVKNQLEGYQKKREKKHKTERWIRKLKKRQYIKEKERVLLARLEKRETVEK